MWQPQNCQHRSFRGILSCAMKTVPRIEDLKAVQYRTWTGITGAFDRFPRPKVDFDDNGEIRERVWIFRGHASPDRLLKPSLERAAEKKRSTSWAALELMLLWEFQAKAPLHAERHRLPPSSVRLDWLALMQHYGVPTRLLDFTYSPYVALYFALRNFNQRNARKKADYVYVLAINGQLLMERARLRSLAADRNEEARKTRIKGGQASAPNLVSLNPDSFATDRDEVQWNRKSSAKLISAAIDPGSDRRALFNREGFVAIAQPTVQNPRLSCQQGVFLVNGAEKQSLHASLFLMMQNRQDEWIKLFKIPASMLPEIERRLFQMNVHELSLFPDLEGVAGFLRQEASLHWDPDDPSDSEQS
jgi:hypothetical protein